MKIKINNYLNSLTFIIPACFIFLISNFLAFLFLYIDSNNAFMEFVKWLQFFALTTLILYILIKFNRTLAFIFVYLVNFFYYTLICFLAITQVKLDYSFLTTGIKDINSVLPQTFLYLMAVFFVALINTLFTYRIKSIFDKKYKKLILIILILFVVLSAIPKNGKYNNDLIVFAKTIYNNNLIIEYYKNFYNNQITKTAANQKTLDIKIKKTKNNNFPYYLDNIIFINLESVNGFLVNEKNTPVLTSLGNENIYFPKLSANGVQTILSQETILCSLPNSFDLNLVASLKNYERICLPEILKQLGYYSFFLKSYDLKFANTGKFMANIKFDEIHADDIMNADDPQSEWGYREDIFYNRVFDYLQKNKKISKNFIYIEVGPTNHWPFDTPKNLNDTVPYPSPRNYQEHLINTTFLQDQYLKIALEKIKEIFPQKNYTLLVFGDHSWPAGLHPGNTFNTRGAFEENFTTSMAVVIGSEYKNKIITNRYSQMDILPSIMDLFGFDYPKDEWRKSFIDELAGKEAQKSKILQIQPYSEKNINIILEQEKYTYSRKSNNLSLCDLTNDPEEKNCKILSNNELQSLNIIKRLMPINFK